MDITGIIAEYNPLHSGHLHHIEETKKAFPGAGIICVMSGNFIQRGDFAIAHKNARARAAVLAGADLVFELPCAHAMACAPVFARGALSLLAATGAVNRLSFGSECGDAELLAAAAAESENPEFRGGLRRGLEKGHSYAAACGGAYSPGLAPLCQSPNNLLGIEYIRAAKDLCPGMEFFTIPRIGSAHDGDCDPGFPSASVLRKGFLSGKTPPAGAIPDFSVSILEAERAEGRFPVSGDGLDRAVLAAVKRLSPAALSQIPEVTEGLENRIFEAAKSAGSAAALLAALKTRRYTKARLRRVMLSAFIGLERSDQLLPPPYLRLLAAGQSGPRLLSLIGERASLPVITKPAHLKRLSGGAADAARLEERADSLYSLAFPGPKARGPGGFYTISPFIHRD